MHEEVHLQDSLTSLALFILPCLAAIWINASGRGWRTTGFALAGVLSLSAAGFLLWQDLGGAFTRFKDPVLPLDVYKPLFLQGWIVFLLIAGLFILYIAGRQSSVGDISAVAVKNDTVRYGLTSRYLHWSMAIMFLLLIPMGIYMSALQETDPSRHTFYFIHKSLGFTILGLVLVRLIWIFRSPVPPQAPDLKKWERVLAKTAHVTLYVFMVGFPISGYLMSSFSGKVSHFYFWDVPALEDQDADKVIPPGLLHKLILPILFYIVIVAHILGVLKHYYMDRKPQIVRRMVS